MQLIISNQYKIFPIYMLTVVEVDIDGEQNIVGF